MATSKQEIIEKSITYWNPDKTKFWQGWGIDLVIGRREGYYIYDMDGRRFLDCHINGGTYSFGHGNPELMEVLRQAMAGSLDVGNHHFPTEGRALLAEKLAKLSPGRLHYSVFTCSGSEAIDVAIKTARHATGRKKIVSVEHAYHGGSGLGVAVGDKRFSDLFGSESEMPDWYQQVPFNDAPALEKVLQAGDVAAFLVETIPATFGFLMPEPGYLSEVRRLTEKYGTLYIADEVQTGLMRSGEMWCVESYGVVPDIIVSGKGLGGGIYPIGAAIIDKRYAGWLHEDGFGHVSTYGGSELGCPVAMRVLDLCDRPEVRSNVAYISEFLRSGLNELIGMYPEFFTGVRQNALIMGLEFNHPEGALHIMKALYQNGIWAIFSAFDPSVLQFKPGLLWDRKLCNEFLDHLADCLPVVQEELKNDKNFGKRAA
jgi:putrescine aminotransferase